MSVIGFTLAVTSSPVMPSPRVAAAAILERNAQAVDLQFGDVRHRAFKVLQATAQPFVECPQLVFVVRVVQAEHRLGMAYGRENFGGTAADALRGGIDRDQIG